MKFILVLITLIINSSIAMDKEIHLNSLDNPEMGNFHELFKSKNVPRPRIQKRDSDFLFFCYWLQCEHRPRSVEETTKKSVVTRDPNQLPFFFRFKKLNFQN